METEAKKPAASEGQPNPAEVAALVVAVEKPKAWLAAAWTAAAMALAMVVMAAAAVHNVRVQLSCRLQSQ